jgi:hypothetical protein
MSIVNPHYQHEVNCPCCGKSRFVPEKDLLKVCVTGEVGEGMSYTALRSFRQRHNYGNCPCKCDKNIKALGKELHK